MVVDLGHLDYLAHEAFGRFAFATGDYSRTFSIVKEKRENCSRIWNRAHETSICSQHRSSRRTFSSRRTLHSSQQTARNTGHSCIPLAILCLGIIVLRAVLNPMACITGSACVTASGKLVRTFQTTSITDISRRRFFIRWQTVVKLGA